MAKKAKTTARKSANKASAKAARGFADTARISVVPKVEMPFREDSRYGKGTVLAAKAGTVAKYREGFAKLKLGTCTAGEVLRGAVARGYLKIA